MSENGKAPAFQFYADHWLADENVRLLTLAETGAYIDAIALCWREGSIPECPDKLSKLIGKGCTNEVASCIQRLFTIRSTSVVHQLNGSSTEIYCPAGRLKHKRLEEERLKQEARKIQASKAGAKSAENKRKSNPQHKNGESQRQFNGSSTSVQRQYNTSSSSSDEDEGVVKTANSGEQDSSASAEASAPFEMDYTAPRSFCINPQVTSIAIGKITVEYHEDAMRWETEFIQRWNKLPGINQRTQKALDTTLRSALQERLKDPDWDWKQAFAMFPLPMGLTYKPNLSWFLRSDTVSKILDGSYQSVQRKELKTAKAAPEYSDFDEKDLED